MMHDPTPRDLNRHIFYLNRRRSQFMAASLKNIGLNGPLYTFLICLEKNPGVSQDFLASFFGLDKGSVARLASRLERMDLITRQACPSDRRQYQLTLTEKGMTLLPMIHDRLNRWSEIMLDGFSAQDRHAAGLLLQRMVDNICHHI